MWLAIIRQIDLQWGGRPRTINWTEMDKSGLEGIHTLTFTAHEDTFGSLLPFLFFIYFYFYFHISNTRGRNKEKAKKTWRNSDTSGSCGTVVFIVLRNVLNNGWMVTSHLTSCLYLSSFAYLFNGYKILEDEAQGHWDLPSWQNILETFAWINAYNKYGVYIWKRS